MSQDIDDLIADEEKTKVTGELFVKIPLSELTEKHAEAIEKFHKAKVDGQEVQLFHSGEMHVYSHYINYGKVTEEEKF
jgi:hypothetical protein